MTSINFATFITHYVTVIAVVISVLGTFLLEIYRRYITEKENFNKVITLISYIDDKLREKRDFANKAIRFDTAFLDLHPYFLIFIIILLMLFDITYKTSESVLTFDIALILNIIIDVMLIILFSIYLRNEILCYLNLRKSKRKTKSTSAEFPKDHLFQIWKDYLSSRNLFYVFFISSPLLVASTLILVEILELILPASILADIFVLIIILLIPIIIFQEIIIFKLETIINDSLKQFANSHENIPKEDLRFSFLFIPNLDDRNIISYAFTIFGYGTPICVDLGYKTVCGELVSITKSAITLKNEEGIHSFPLNDVRSATKPNKMKNALKSHSYFV